MIRVTVNNAPIDVGAELGRIEQGGAVATFTGLVRADDGVTGLTLEHYPGATEASLLALANAAVNRWSLLAVSIVHRVGPMRPGERIVFIGAVASHRAAALEACSFLIDRLKNDAPFWKKETRAAGESWVGERAADHASAARWR